MKFNQVRGGLSVSRATKQRTWNCWRKSSRKVPSTKASKVWPSNSSSTLLKCTFSPCLPWQLSTLTQEDWELKWRLQFSLPVTITTNARWSFLLLMLSDASLVKKCCRDHMNMNKKTIAWLSAMEMLKSFHFTGSQSQVLQLRRAKANIHLLLHFSLLDFLLDHYLPLAHLLRRRLHFCNHIPSLSSDSVACFCLTLHAVHSHQSPGAIRDLHESFHVLQRVFQ